MLNKYRGKVGSPATTIIDFMLGRGSKCKTLLYRHDNARATNAGKVMFKFVLIHRVSTDYAVFLISLAYILIPILRRAIFVHFP